VAAPFCLPSSSPPRGPPGPPPLPPRRSPDLRGAIRRAVQLAVGPCGDAVPFARPRQVRPHVGALGARHHASPSSTGRYSHSPVSSSKNASSGGSGGGGGGAMVVDAYLSLSMYGVPEPANRPVARSYT